MNPPSVDTAQESVQIPDDFAAYEKWRETGDLPKEEETGTPAAEPEVKTETPESEPEEKQQEPGQKGRGYQKRIDQLIGRIRDLEARLEPAGETRPGPASPQPTEPTAPGEPKAEDYESYDALLAARIDWKLEQREQAREAKRELQAQIDAWTSRATEAAKKMPDWAEVVSGAEMPLSEPLRQAIVTSERGPEVAYYLATHPDEADAIAKLPPVAQVRQLGRIEAKFEQPAEPPKPKASKAPPPPAPVAGQAKASATDIHDENLANDFGAWEKARNAQLRRRR